jgi:uncharacterized protein
MTMAEKPGSQRSQPKAACEACSPRNTARDHIEIAAVFVLLFGALLLLKQLDVLPRYTLSENVNYGLVLLIGLTASVSTCIAVTGGLLVAVAARYNEATLTVGAERLKPHVYFNVGRIVSYTALGAAIGALGSALSFSQEVNGILMLAASAVMIVLGLQMLRLFPSLGLFQSMIPERVALRLQELTQRGSRPAAFLLGASTFFLPCGFTQALQLYVLAKGSAYVGAMTMLVFSLGTLPALMSLSAVSSFARGAFQRYFLKFAGMAVVVLGLINIEYGLVLTGSGVNFPSVAGLLKTDNKTVSEGLPIVDGHQVADMKVVGLNYEPHRFVVRQGIPVRWRISAQEAEGCGRVLIVRKLAIRKFLSASADTVITFTPDQPGEIDFNCGMGMMTPGSKFIVVAKN